MQTYGGRQRGISMKFTRLKSLKFVDFRKMYFKSLQVRIMFVILIFLFIPVSILLNYNFSQTEAVLLEKTSSLILGNLEQLGNKVENITEDITKISSIASSDNLIISRLSQNRKIFSLRDFDTKDLQNLNIDELIKVTEIERQINFVKSNFFNYNTHVVLFGADGIVYSALGNISDEFDFKMTYQREYKNEAWYKQLESSGENVLWTAPFNYSISGVDKQKRYISLARIIKNNYTQTIQGIIMVNLSEDDLRRSLESNANGTITLLNQKKEIIFSSDSEKTGGLSFQSIYSETPTSGKGCFSSDIADKKYFINYYTIDKTGWTLTSIMPYEDVMKEISSLRNKTYTINFIIFGIFLVICFLMILYITYPLKKLLNKIRKTKIGDYRIGSKEPEQLDDVSDIVNSFDYMFKRVEDLVNIVIEEQKYENDLKYEALRAQINPHFLFNTLNTIKWSALMSGSENVSKMISSLGKLLEVSINKGEDEISLREELELIESYVYIQNIRFNDIFKLVFDVDEELKEAKVLKLILQPIVENSIIHGLKTKMSSGEITISAAVKESKLYITVKDNGVGISRDKVDRILNSDYENREHKYTSIGLINIHERLKIKYGNEYGLEIASEEGSGTMVSVLLPILKNR